MNTPNLTLVDHCVLTSGWGGPQPDMVTQGATGRRWDQSPPRSGLRSSTTASTATAQFLVDRDHVIRAGAFVFADKLAVGVHGGNHDQVRSPVGSAGEPAGFLLLWSAR